MVLGMSRELGHGAVAGRRTKRGTAYGTLKAHTRRPAHLVREAPSCAEHHTSGHPCTHTLVSVCLHALTHIVREAARGVEHHPRVHLHGGLAAQAVLHHRPHHLAVGVLGGGQGEKGWVTRVG